MSHVISDICNIVFAAFRNFLDFSKGKANEKLARQNNSNTISVQFRLKKNIQI